MYACVRACVRCLLVGVFFVHDKSILKKSPYAHLELLLCMPPATHAPPLEVASAVPTFFTLSSSVFVNGACNTLPPPPLFMLDLTGLPPRSSKTSMFIAHRLLIDFRCNSPLLVLFVLVLRRSFKCQLTHRVSPRPLSPHNYRPPLADVTAMWC